MQVTLAKRYKEQNVTGWLMGEKLDGWRALWTGKEFITRTGNKINAPEWFTSKLPSFPLDGELHAGRGAFNIVHGILQKTRPLDADWSLITFSVFDAPSVKGCYANRLRYLNTGGLGLNVISFKTCYSYAHLTHFFIKLIWGGAEGVVIRNPKAPYENFRSTNMLKLKPRFYAEGGLLSAIGAAVLTFKKTVTFKLIN